MIENKDQDLLQAIETLSDRIDKQNTILASFLKSQTSIKMRLIAGLWTGLGTVLGATVVVSGIVLLLKPLSKIDWISPIVDKVIVALESRGGPPRTGKGDQQTGAMYNSDSN
jgi:Domain of unknown function (DUF5665)